MKNFTYQGLLILAYFAVTFAGPAEGLINQMTPPDNTGDVQVRIDLRQMTHDMMAPPEDSAAWRIHVQDLINGLNRDIDWHIKADLMRELELIGRETAIPVLGTYLSHDDLCRDAAMAIERICRTTDCTAGRTAVKSALTSETDTDKLVTLIQLAGHIGAVDATVVDIMEQNASAQDWTLRSTSLRALAEIGDPGSADVLAAAITTENAHEKAEIITWNLSYARLLARQGLKTEAAAIAEAVKALGEGPENLGGSQGNVHVITAAELTLEEIQLAVKVNGDGKGKNTPAINLSLLSTGEGGSDTRLVIKVMDPYTISITNILGKAVWNRKGNTSENITLPGSLFRPGYYAVNVESGKEKLVKSIIVK